MIDPNPEALFHLSPTLPQFEEPNTSTVDIPKHFGDPSRPAGRHAPTDRAKDAAAEERRRGF